jgi:hypothetical protein
MPGDVDRLVLIDAHSGTRCACSSASATIAQPGGVTNDNDPALADVPSPVRIEGGPLSRWTGAADVNSAYDLTGMTDGFTQRLGRDSVDNQGLLKSTSSILPNSPSTVPSPTPSGTATQMVYGRRLRYRRRRLSAHELTHGVTDATSRTPLLRRVGRRSTSRCLT